MWRLATVLALIVGWLAGGSLRNLGEHKLKALWAIILSAGLQIFISFLEPGGSLSQMASFVHVLSYAPLFWAFWVNRKIAGISLLGLGSLLNFVVIVANGGRMPVGQTALAGFSDPMTRQVLEANASFTHQLASASTRVRFLGDVMLFPDLRVFPDMMLSIGDIIMAVGFVFLLRYLMLSPQEAASKG